MNLCLVYLKIYFVNPQEGRAEEVKTLLAAGADPEYKDYGNTALHISAETESNTEVWATLLRFELFS